MELHTLYYIACCHHNSTDRTIKKERNKSTMAGFKSLNIIIIGSLYIYKNTPVVYGTPAPKVAESVLKAYKNKIISQADRSSNY